MQINILAEPAYAGSSWCRTILDGLTHELNRKRMEFQILRELPTDTVPDQNSYFILIASDLQWVTTAVMHCNSLKIHPIILSCQPRRPISGLYSYVTSDIPQSMRYLLSYLSKQGRHRPALYGINPASLPNLACKESFVETAEYPDANQHVYYNDESLKSCFEAFYPNISSYDCVICANDYAAVSLIRNLNLQQFSPKQLLIVSYGGTLLSAHFTAGLLSISMCYEEFGKAAITICETLSKNDALLYMNIAVKWKIRANKTFQLPEFRGETQAEILSDAMLGNQTFYRDQEIREMILIENMLHACDATDLQILNMILNGCSNEHIADVCFLSHNAVKYRIKKMMVLCDCDSKRKFINFLRTYYHPNR